MSEKNNETNRHSTVEKAEVKQLEKAKTKEVKLNKAEKAEIASKENELAHKGKEAEKVLKAEKEKHLVEHSKEKLSHEKLKTDEREVKDPASYTSAEKKSAYKKELKKVRAQLPKRSQSFSKFVHSPVVEKVSDVAAKTVLRPSVLIGGSIVGISLGLVVYIVARYYGYVIPSMTLILFLLVGGIIGALVEFVFHRFHHVKDA